MRRAVTNVVIHRKIIAEKVIQGQGIPRTPTFLLGCRASSTPRSTPDFGLELAPSRRACTSWQGSKYEGGENWPKITLSMPGDEGTNPKAMAEAIQAMLAQHLQMHVELQISDSAFPPAAVEAPPAVHFIRWFAHYPDPHNDMMIPSMPNSPAVDVRPCADVQLQHPAPTGARNSTGRSAGDLYAGREILQQDVGYVPVGARGTILCDDQALGAGHATQQAQDKVMAIAISTHGPENICISWSIKDIPPRPVQQCLVLMMRQPSPRIAQRQSVAHL